MNKMPRKVINDYTFYKIVCLDNSVELCYVGSTADFNKRRSTHKSDCNNENSKKYNLKIYKTIRENGGWDNFKMIQLGTREQLNKRQAEQIEDEYRITLKANMNTIRCFTTEEQKQEQMKERNKKYRKSNIDKILEYQQKYREENKNYFKEYNQKYQQNYREENRNKKLEYNQNYREDNRDKINEKALEKVKCECGCMICKTHLSRHQKSPKHINLINKINSIME